MRSYVQIPVFPAACIPQTALRGGSSRWIPTENGNQGQTVHPDVGTFKPKIRNKKLLAQKLHDYTSDLKHALLIHFETGKGQERQVQRTTRETERQKSSRLSRLRIQTEDDGLLGLAFGTIDQVALQR